MKNKGISLITLIITIVVIIILSAAVILAFSNTSVIDNAKKAQFLQKLSTYQDEIDFYVNNRVVDTLGKITVKDIYAYNLEQIKAIIKSFNDEDEGKYIIIDAKLVYIGTNEKEIGWLEGTKIQTEPGLDVTNLLSLTITSDAETEEKLRTNKSSITYTFTFTDDVEDFEINDIDVINITDGTNVTDATKGEFKKVSNSVYTLVVTNTESCTQVVVVEAAKCNDSRNIQNLRAVYEIVIDRDSPVLEKIEITDPEDGEYNVGQELTIVATFNEDIYNSSSVKISEDLVSAPTLNIKFGTGNEKLAIADSATDKTITYKYELQIEDEGDLTLYNYSGTVYDDVGNQADINRNQDFDSGVISSKIKAEASISFENATITKEFEDADFINNLTNTGDGTVTFATSNGSVASVDENGVVTIGGVGTTTITATVSDTMNNKYATRTISYTLNVNPKVVAIPTSPENKSYDGTSKTHGVSVPTEASVIEASSILSATEPGEYQLVVSLNSPNYKWSDNTTENKTVIWRIIDNRTLASISFTHSSMTKEYGDALFTNYLTNTGDGEVTYTSSDTSVATIDSSGIVTLGTPGTTAIIATVSDTLNYKYDTKQVSYTLTVNQKSLSIPSSPADVSYDGQSHNHGITIPTGAEIVTASSTLSAINPGNYTVVVALSDPNYIWSDGTTSNRNVTWTIVDNRAQGSISYSTVSVTKSYGDAMFMNALTHTGDSTVTYASSNTSVATINSSGTVTVGTPGTTTITATVTDTLNYKYATKTASYTLTVNKAAGSISYSGNETKTYGAAAFTKTLTKTGNGTVTYSSSNTSVATVNSSTGAVTIKAAGTAVITATVVDSSTYTYATKTASYTLTVNKKSISVSSPADKLYSGSSQAHGITIPTGAEIVSTGSTLSATDEGSYTVVVKLSNSNYIWSDNTTANKNVTWKIYVTESMAVAKIGTTFYRKVATALNMVPNNKTQTTIQLIKNTSENVTVTSNKNVILNLGGKTFTSASTSAAAIKNQGTLQIYNGTVTSTDYRTLWNNGGTLKVTGGTYTCTSSYVIYNDSSGKVEVSGSSTFTSTSSYAIYNASGATATLGGSSTFTSTSSYAVANQGTITVNSNPTITNDGGSDTHYAAFWSNGTAYINSGKFESTNGDAIRNGSSGTMTITGGTINASNRFSVYNDGTLTIEGGTYTNSKALVFYNDTYATATVTGGTFTSTSTSQCAVGNWGVMRISGTTKIIKDTSGTNSALANSGKIQIDNVEITCKKGHAFLIQETGTAYINGGTFTASASGKYGVRVNANCTLYYYSGASFTLSKASGSTVTKSTSRVSMPD